jgi:biofilm PGA synthesis N-glycosyltransferase PgaC
MDIGAIGLYVCLFVALYFEVVLLISFFERRPAKKNALLPDRYPKVAIVVPCYNEERTVGKTIESLLAMTYPAKLLEIVVVDDGSQDNTGAIAESYAAKDGRVKYFRKQNGGKYTALNFAIERTDAEIVGCLDADSFVEKDALLEAVKMFERDPSVMAITPAMKVYRPRKLLERMQAVEYTFGIFYKKMFDNLSAINVLPGPFSMYRKSVFDTIGLFRHAYNTEDMEIAFRMHAHGLKIVNAHTSLVYTTVPQTVRALLRQRTRWSRGFLENARDYAYMFCNPKYGNFGMLILPFGLTAFAAGLYTGLYALYRAVSLVAGRIGDFYATGVPPHLPQHLSWYYIDTNMMLFVIVAVFLMTFVAIALGSRIAGGRISPLSLAAYFTLFGFIAPLWLARAALETALARKHTWR